MADFRPTRVEEPPRDPRVHVGIDDTTGTSQEGMLYTVEYRAFEQSVPPEPRSAGAPSRYEWSFVARVRTERSLGELHGVGTLGGERRLVWVEPYNGWLECRQELKDAIKQAKYGRMVLATPAIFSKGWLPGWLQEEEMGGSRALIGCPPTMASTGLKLRLIGAAVPRRVPVSGWSLRRSGYGPKPVRWCAPAGAVYFFEVVAGDSAKLVDGWLQPVSDTNLGHESGTRYCESGYGLALWGVWTPETGGVS